VAKQGAAPLIALAEKYIGLPYKWGGTSPKTGFDCSGFVQWLYAQQGVQIPRVTYDQANAGTPVEKADLKPGDIVFFEPSAKGPGHEGLFIGDGKFIESPHTGASIRISTLADRSDYTGARRVIPDGAPLIGNVAQATPPDAVVPQATVQEGATAPLPSETAASPEPSPAPAAIPDTGLPAPQALPIVPPAPSQVELAGGSAQLAGGSARLAGGSVSDPWQQLSTLQNPSPDTVNLIAMAGQGR
jgi:X-X-X-Leu-X-X-Gly heptad repeat protein